MSQALVDYQKLLINAFKKDKESYGYKYHKWFKENAVLFEQVDKLRSELISIKHHCQIKQCYRNAWVTATSDSSLKYYEGFVISNNCPVRLEHSWVVKNGIVIDPTLIIRVEGMKERIGQEYYGIHIPTDYVRKKAFQTGKSGAYILDYYGERIGKTLG